MAGTKVLASERNAVMTAIDNARAKWGLGKKTSNATAGTTKATAADYNNLVTWLTEAKTASNGSTTAIESKVTAGVIMTQNKLTNLTSQANAIYNYCKCHGNCTGSCTGSCSGGCTGSCDGGCKTSCRHSCKSQCGGGGGDSGH